MELKENVSFFNIIEDLVFCYSLSNLWYKRGLSENNFIFIL